jgi:hypothetical protein
METQKTSTEVIFRVVDESEGVFLEIGPDEDGNCLEIRTTNQASKEWFGDIRFLITTKEFARQLGEAIIKASENNKFV